MNNIKRTLNLTLPASEVKMGPPVGTIMGQFSIKIKNFCDSFNEQTQFLPKGIPVKSEIKIYDDKSFDIEIKKVPLTFLVKIAIIKKKINIKDLYKCLILNDSFFNQNKKYLKEIISYLKLNKINIIF